MKNVIIVLLIVLAGAGFWYQKIYVPGQEKMAEMQRELAKIKKEEEEQAVLAEKKATADLAAEEKARAEAEKTEVAVVEPELEEVVEEKAPEVVSQPEEPVAEENDSPSKMEIRDAKLAKLTAQLDAKNAEFERKRLELQNKKEDLERIVVEARNQLAAKRTELNSGNLRKSATDQARILEPFITRHEAAVRQREELEKAWNQYFSDRKIMETNYRAAVRKVIDETR